MKTNPSSQFQLNDDRKSVSRLGRKRNSLADFFSPRTVVATTVAVLFGLLPTAASATLINSSIVISGSAEFDSTGSPSAPSGSASQSGTLKSIVGGVLTTTTLSGAIITGTDPLAGTLTSIGDGFGIDFNAGGNNASGIGNLFGDYLFSISNTSLIDTFTINLKLDFNHQVNANGDDAFALSQIRLADSLSSTEYFFSGLSSDTVNGNHRYISSDNTTDSGAGFGGSLSDSGSSILSFTLAPGDSINLGDGSFELFVLGGTAGPGSFSAAVTSLITVDSVVTSRQNPTVPEPETLFLFGIGLTLFRLTYRGR